MTTAATSLLGLALPVTGELSGTWGDTVNNSITSLLDTAVAGTTTLSTDGDVTLSTTTLAANQARQAILLCSGARTAIRTITAPAQSKIYTIINATTGGYAVKIVGVGPTTGISIPAGQTATVAWNGSDFVDASNYTNGNKYINGNLTVTGTTTLSGGTANGVAYLNGSKVVTTGSALTFDGTNLGVGLTPSGSFRLEIGGADGTQFAMRSTGTTSARIRGYVNSAESGVIGFLNGGGQYFEVAGSEGMRLTSTGLGIGTSSPQKKLVVSNGGAVGMEWSPTDYTGNMRQLVYNRSTSAYVALRTEASQHEWYIGGSESMRLDSSGNLGIGVTPSAWYTGGTLKAQQIGALGGISIVQRNSTESYIGQNFYFDSTNSSVRAAAGYSTRMGFYNGSVFWELAGTSSAGSAISYTQAMTLDASGKLLVGWTTAPSASASVIANGIQCTNTSGGGGFLNLGTSGGGQQFYTHTGVSGSETYTERARIDSSGNLLLGTTSSTTTPANGVQLNNPTTNSTVAIGHASGTASGNYYVNFGYAGTSIGSITQSGTTAVLYNVTSDQRLKENIIDAPEFGSVIDAIQVRSYDWKADGNHQRAGFVAQELVTVAPEAVHQPTDPEEMMAVDYSKLVPMLVKEIQSLRKRVAELEAK